MSSVNYVTKEALEHLRSELQRMKTVDRPAASRAIAEAREKGDLKENAEYDGARKVPYGIGNQRFVIIDHRAAPVWRLA